MPRCAGFATGLTVHKQIMISMKHKITKLVIDTKTNYYSLKVATSTSCKELFRLTGNLMGRVRLLFRLFTLTIS